MQYKSTSVYVDSQILQAHAVVVFVFSFSFIFFTCVCFFAPGKIDGKLHNHPESCVIG